MSIRTQSLFRPRKPIDQSVLKENRKLVEDINRRGLLRGAVSLGALTMLTGCDVTENDSVQKALRAVSAWNDGVQETIFRPNHLAPTFSPSQVVKPARFNAYYDIEDVKPIDGATWKLELAGPSPINRLGPRSRFISSRSRRSSFGTSAWRVGTISANGPA
jgi:hypothetical protein